MILVDLVPLAPGAIGAIGAISAEVIANHHVPLTPGAIGAISAKGNSEPPCAINAWCHWCH